MPKVLASESGTGLAVLALAGMSATACVKLDDDLYVNEWKSAPLARTAEDGRLQGRHLQGVPLLPPTNDPAATRSVVAAGTGNLIAPSARNKSMPAPSKEEGVTLNLVNTSIAESAKTILGDILGLNYSVNSNLA